MEKIKTLIIGSEGMLGHVVYQYFKNLDIFDVIGISRKNGNFTDKILELTNFVELNSYILEMSPNYIINCAGVLVKNSQENILNAIQINSYLPHYLSNIAREIDSKLIHISTDCVFSGKTGSYSENSFRDGDDNYARTKALGEVINSVDLTIRTSIVGPELKSDGTGLLHWFLNQKGEIFGYSNAYWSGVTTLQLAKTIHKMITENLSGIYNLTTTPKISKYELLNLFSRVWNKNIKIDENSNYFVDKSLISVNSNFQYENIDYYNMLIDLKEWMIQYSQNYQHYTIFQKK